MKAEAWAWTPFVISFPLYFVSRTRTRMLTHLEYACQQQLHVCAAAQLLGRACQQSRQLACLRSYHHILTFLTYVHVEREYLCMLQESVCACWERGKQARPVGSHEQHTLCCATCSPMTEER